jgi:hypothetical protein
VLYTDKTDGDFSTTPFFFGGNGVWQGFLLARLVFLCSTTSATSPALYIWMSFQWGSHVFTWASLDCDQPLTLPASYITGRTGACHHNKIFAEIRSHFLFSSNHDLPYLFLPRNRYLQGFATILACDDFQIKGRESHYNKVTLSKIWRLWKWQT